MDPHHGSPAPQTIGNNGFISQRNREGQSSNKNEIFQHQTDYFYLQGNWEDKKTERNLKCTNSDFL